MVDSVGMDGKKNPGVDEAEITLRLIAALPAPQGLADRVHARLRAAPRRSGILAWPAPLTRQTGWVRGVAAAAIVCVVAGGGWGIYSRVLPGGAAPTIAGQGTAGARSFSTGDALRKPQTLEGPAVPKISQPAVAETAPVGTAAGTAAKPAAMHAHAAQLRALGGTRNPTPVTPLQ